MNSCMEGHPNLIVEWDFRNVINQRNSHPSPYTVDRWGAEFKPEIIRRWQEWKRMRDEWAEFLRTSGSPYRCA